MVLEYVPTLGVSKDANSALNRASLHDFNIIRSQISGTRPYQASDLMIYRVAVDSLRDLYEYAVRIYKIMSRWGATNFYQPTHYLQAMHLDAADWRAHASDLYQWLKNNATALLHYPTVPMGSIPARRKLLNSSFFTDGDIEKCQTYIINQTWFWSYEKVDTVKGLTLREFPSKYNDFITMWNEMYNALRLSDDVAIITSDIRRAFGENVITALEPPAELDEVPIVKNDDMLVLIMNASISSLPFFTGTYATNYATSFRVYDESSLLMCKPGVNWKDLDLSTAAIQTYAGYLSHINMLRADPSPEEVLAATRFKSNVTVGKTGVNKYSITFNSIGTETIIRAYVYTIDEKDAYEAIAMGTTMLSLSTATDHAQFVRFCSYISQFDWHPPIYMSEVSDKGLFMSNAHGIVEDVQNYVPLNRDQLKMIHEATLLSEFGIG
jgi:hypothetical protein